VREKIDSALSPLAREVAVTEWEYHSSPGAAPSRPDSEGREGERAALGSLKKARPEKDRMDMDRWRLDPREVTSGYESTSEPARCMAHLPPGADMREYVIWLEHPPTGQRMAGVIPIQPCTRQELELVEIEMRKALFAELELKVSRHLGGPGA